MFINARQGEVAAAGAPQGKSSGAGAKTEQPVCEQAVAFSLGGLQELKLLTLFAKHFHIQVAVGFDPILVDFDRQRTNEPQAALLIRKDADDMGAAFELLIDPLEHIGALKMFVVFSRKPVKGQSFLNVFFHPCAELWIFLLPSKEPGRQVSAGFLGVMSIVKPSQFDQAVVGNLAGQIVERVT